MELEETEVLDSEELNRNDIAEKDAVDEAAAPISYSGQDFDVDGLVRRLINKDIIVPYYGEENALAESEGFQRSFVWRKPQMDKFVESILLGYPIPGVFLVKQTDKRYLVLDGQQRLMTLKYFKEGLYRSKEFKLESVAEDFRDLTYKTLDDDKRRDFDNTFIQAIVVNSDGSQESLESIYQIFERLNSGGTQLTANEIRVALYAGSFVKFIETLNNNEDWRFLYGKKSPRLRDHELVLRIISFYRNYSNYSSPLKKFLNDFVSIHRNLDNSGFEEEGKLFGKAAKILRNSVGADALKMKTQVTASLAEAVFVGLMNRLNMPDTIDESLIGSSVKKLKEQAASAILSATSTESNVAQRIQLAIKLFAEC